MAKKNQEQVTREVKLSDNQKLVVSSFLTDDGSKHLNVRKFYRTQKDPNWKPAAQGLTLSQEKAKKAIKMLIEAFKNMDEEAVALPPRGGKKGKNRDNDD